MMNELIEIENALLGSFILFKDSFDELYPLMSEVRLEGRNGIVLNAIIALSKEGAPIDLLTVVNKLRDTGELDSAGGAVYVAELTRSVSQSVSEYHTFLLKERDIKAKIYRVGAKILREAFKQNCDVFDLLAELDEDLSNARAGLARVKTSNVAIAVEDYRLERKDVIDGQNGLIGITTGIRCLDARLKGWRKKLYIVAGRPGMGKSALMTFSALRTAFEGNPVAIFSFEMGRAEIVGRMIAAFTGLDSEMIANHEYVNTHHQATICVAENAIAQLPIFIEECGGMSALDVKAIAQRLDIEAQKRYGGKRLQAVFVDYLQLMSSENSKAGNREQEVSGNSRALKLLSKKYPVIAFSQLSRDVEKRGGDKRPQLSDLRESGAIEQDADAVIFLYRPEYYNMTEDNEGNVIPAGLCEFIIRKLRGGRIGTEVARLDLRTMSFDDINEF